MCSWLQVGLLVEQGRGEACHYDWLKARLFVVLCLKFTALRRCSSLCFEVIDDRCEILYLSSLSLACHRPRKPPFPWIPLQSSARYTRLVVPCAGWVVLAALPSGCGPLLALEEPWMREWVEFSSGVSEELHGCLSHRIKSLDLIPSQLRERPLSINHRDAKSNGNALTDRARGLDNGLVVWILLKYLCWREAGQNCGQI